MEPSFWHLRWQRNEIGFHQDRINSHLQQHWPALELTDKPTVFVPLCGKSRDLLWLRSQGHDVLGVELSPIAVEDFFEENGLLPTVTPYGRFIRWQCDGLAILCGDFFDLDERDLRQVGALYDRASLVALPKQVRERYVRHLADLLPPGTPCLLVAMDYPQAEMSGPPFSVPDEEVFDLMGTLFQVEPLHCAEVLDENPRLKTKGLTRLTERVYRLQRAE